MKIQLKFKNINQQPECKITANDCLIYQGSVIPIVACDLDINEQQIKLKIEFTNKRPEDTVVCNDIIVQDKNFELEQIMLDEYDIEELIWRSNYFADDGQIFTSCLFFGPPGYYEIDFYQPVLHWLLKTRNDINNNDPDWETDYHYYTEACQLLTLI